MLYEVDDVPIEVQVLDETMENMAMLWPEIPQEIMSEIFERMPEWSEIVAREWEAEAYYEKLAPDTMIEEA